MRDRILMLAIVATGCVATIVFAERIGVNAGLGWDGRAYGHWAANLPSVLAHHQLDGFQAQRVLPSAIVYATHTSDVIRGFQIVDAVMLVGTCACLCRIGAVLGWSRLASWAAFVSLFGSFAVARHALYDPVLTDPTALFLGALSLVGYVERRTWIVIASALAATFTWPALIVVNAAALCFPRSEPRTTERLRGIRPRHLAIAASVLAAGMMLDWFLHVLATAHNVVGMEGPLSRAHHALYPVTIATFVVLGAAAAWFLAAAWDGPALAGAVRRKPLVVGVMTIAALFGLKTLWIHRVASGDGFTFETLEYFYVGQAVRAPLWSMVHHVVYFGPIVILVVARWPRITRAARAWGLAPTIVWAAAVAVAVTPETRHLIAFLPWIVVLSIDALRDSWSPRALAVFTVLTLVWSKVWFVIGYDAYHDSYAFPDQRYMMNLGPWATDATFIGHAIAAAATAAILLVAVRPRRVT